MGTQNMGIGSELMDLECQDSLLYHCGGLVVKSIRNMSWKLWVGSPATTDQSF